MSIFIVPKNSGLKICKDIANVRFSELPMIEVRGEDVPLFVERLIESGKNVIGITGEDLFAEYKMKGNSSLRVLNKLPFVGDGCLFQKPTLCLLGPKDKDLDPNKKIKIALSGKYKKICSGVIEKLKNRFFDIELLYLKGCTEEMYELGLCDMVIDIVYSGRSARNVGLEVYEKIFSSDIVVIGGEEK